MSSYYQNFCLCIPQRWIIATMGFSAFFNAYALRSCLPMAITQMAIPLKSIALNSVGETCPDLFNGNDTNGATLSLQATFAWSEYTQGIILSSFYWGYILTHVPGGLWAEKYGPERVMGLAIFITSVLTLIIPSMTVWGDSTALIVLQFFIGLCEGVVHPAMSSLIAQWIPTHEISFISSLVYYGSYFGVLVPTSLSGFIMGRFNNDWQLIFYLFGGIGIAWFFFWIMIFSNFSRSNGFSLEGENELLGGLHGYEKKQPFPWKHALTSKPFLALVIVRFGSDWCNYTILSDLPMFMNNVLKLPIELNGYASSIYLMSSRIFSVAASWISDKVISRRCASTTIVRKINTTIASIGPGIFLLSAMYAGCNVVLVVSLITIGLTMTGSAVPGALVNVIDLSPNYAGTLMGIANGVGALCGILAPYTVGVLAPDQTFTEWRHVFWIIFSVYCVTALNFVAFASGEVQPWNYPEFLTNQHTKYDRFEESVRLKKFSRYKPVNELFYGSVSNK